jgi:LuxR family maltose regulon positive regulatory protein
MTFSIHESISSGEDQIDHPYIYQDVHREPAREEFHLLREKLTIPGSDELIERPRIAALLEKSIVQFPATLISGRAGTGKTSIAASFVAGKKNVSWYSVETTDVEWPIFARYFSASLSNSALGGEKRFNNIGPQPRSISPTEIARFLVNRFASAYAGPPIGPSVVVLDDIHHLFDVPWFDDFFNLLLYSLPPETHLLLLCRSKPPSPLWRLRSKQMLNVLDEKVIAFDTAETQTLFNKLGGSTADPTEAQARCFGRVSKLLQAASEPV